MMKRLVLASLVAGVSMPAAAGEVDDWAREVGRRIERVAAAPANPVIGLVTVRLRRGPTGHPVDVRVISADGNAELERMTRRSMARLRPLPPMPAGMAADTPIMVKLLFGAEDTPAHAFEHRRAYRQMAAAATDANADLVRTELARR